ncbi:hypothetical protein [Lutibacter sp.]|uniref:hypothetical protein n=1 Tax=Lutibacter sp. TaxID=1925666 RepID=UPI0025C1BDB5|nr:hypothetical protein [Lutibacter sp.]MCF6181015.1 hypothetical protein [Lutibacter sp.]
MKKEIVIGFLTALIATFFGCYLFIEYFSNKGFYETIKLITEGNLESKVLVIGAIANFFVFFIFLKKKQIYRARGVLLATFLIAFLVLFLTIFGK